MQSKGFHLILVTLISTYSFKDFESFGGVSFFERVIPISYY